MAATDAELCNLALNHIGSLDFIDELDEEGAAAEVCNVIYATTRDAALERVWWPFATRRALPAAIDEDLVSRSGWGYAYALPDDCIAMRYIYPGTRAPTAQQRIPFVTENDADVGMVVLTDQEDAELVYTARIEEVPRFSPLFQEALAWSLAAKLALSISKDARKAMAMNQQFELAIARATASVFRQQREDLPPEAEHIRNR